jgi:hypothetical protein
MMAMDRDNPPEAGFMPLVPPPRGTGPEDLLALQRRGIEMVSAANRLALTWLQAAATQHAQMTRRTLDEMMETARRMAVTEAPPDKAQAVLEMLDRAQTLGLQTAQEIAALMQRMQGDTVALMGQVLRGGRGDE